MRDQISYLLFALLSIAWFPLTGLAVPEQQQKPKDWQVETARQIVQELRLDCDIDQNDLVLFGSSLTIAKNETITSDVVILGGGLVVEGVLEGNAVVIGGSIYLASSALVKGKVVAMGGIVEKEEGAVIESGFFELGYTQYPKPPAPPSPQEPASPPGPQEPVLYKETKDLVESARGVEHLGDIVKFGSDIHIASNQVIKGDVVAIGGNILIEGKVEGDVVSTQGDISIGPEGEVGGDVFAALGKIEIKPGAKIKGNVIEQGQSGTRNLRSQPPPDTTQKSAKMLRMPAGILDYNRVDGLYLGLLISENKSHHPMPDYRFEGGYSFKRQRWLYDFEIDQPLTRSPRLSVGVHIYDRTKSNDEDLISDAENLFATAFLKKDYRDYFDLRGAAGFVALIPLDAHTLRFNYSQDEYRPLETKAHASIFRRKRNFEPNPVGSRQICQADTICCKKVKIKTFNVCYEFDSRPKDLIKTPDRGLWLRLSGEWARRDWGSTYSYDRYSADIREYLTFSAGQYLALRINLGLLDITPEKRTKCTICAGPQYFFPKEFYVGGIGTLPGYEYKQFRGTHMVLLNFEYAWQLRRRLWALFFCDAGDAKGSVPMERWTRNDLWQALKLKSDAGIGFRYEDPGEYSITVAMAQRLVKVDNGDQTPPVLIVRAARIF